MGFLVWWFGFFFFPTYHKPTMTGPQSDRFQISCMRHTGQKKHVMYMLGMECLWDPSNLLPKLFAEEHFKYPVKVNGQLCRRSHVAMPIEQYTTCKDHWSQYTLSCFGGSKIWSSLAVMCSDSNLMHCQECKQEVKTSDISLIWHFWSHTCGSVSG